MDPKKRFSHRAEYYDRYRPRYPNGIVGFMERDLGFSSSSVVADIGSGTGILSELFLKNGNLVFGIEPNSDMRKMAEKRLSAYPNFRSIDGSAEATTLPNGTLDIITAAQSFHWFDPVRAKQEFRRILRDNGWVVLVWNARKPSTPFLQAYDELTKSGAMEKRRVRHEELREVALKFLGNHRAAKLTNSQELDREGLIGRLLSASYAPLPGEPVYDEIVARVSEIFERYQNNGVVKFEYETEVYAGQVS